MRHYHVTHGMRGGYMPDGSEAYATEAEARAAAEYEVEQYREVYLYDDGGNPTGWAEEGSLDDGLVTFDFPSDPYVLGFYVQCYECDDVGCQPDDDDDN